MQINTEYLSKINYQMLETCEKTDTIRAIAHRASKQKNFDKSNKNKKERKYEKKRTNLVFLT